MNIVNQVKPLPLPPGNLGLPIIGLNRIFQQNPRNYRQYLYQKSKYRTKNLEIA